MLNHKPFPALFFGAFLLASCSGEEPVRGANVVLITLDTVRADRLGVYGGPAGVTPALDRLAGEGARFEQASAAAPLTLPSHATLLSGLLPPHHGLRNNGGGVFPEDRATLATALAGAGYRTGAFVGAFVLDRRFGLARGFEVYDDEVERDPAAGARLEAERPGREVVDRALAWLGREDPRPFFLWVHLYDAHAPYEPPSPFRERFAGRSYDGEVAAVDEQVGRILAELERRGLVGRTVVAVTADHGEGLGDHGESTHGLLLYESTLRVPLLLRGPGIAPRVVATPVSLADVAPTLAALVGRPLPPAGPAGALDGRDLSAALLASQEPAPAEVYAETRYPAVFGWSPLSSLRRREMKAIDAPRPELYDLAGDPGETANRAEADPRALAGFLGRLDEIQAGAVETRRAAADPMAGDAEARARLESLGYLTGAGASGSGRAAEGAPRGADPKDRVALFQRFEAAAARLGAGDVKPALEELSALVAEDPENPVFRGKLAQAWRGAGVVERAVPLYRQAAEDAPDDPEAWYNLASALQEAGRAGEAREAVERAIGLDPGRPEAHNTLGIVHLSQGRMEEALREFARAAELDPRNAPALNNLGNALRAVGRLDEAEAAYRRSAASAPRYPEPLNGLGTLAVARDRPAEALSYFERALLLAPGYHEVRLNRAIALELAGQAPAAVEAYRDFLAATGESAELARHFAEQRQAAHQLLDRLLRQAGAAPAGRR